MCEMSWCAATVKEMEKAIEGKEGLNRGAEGEEGMQYAIDERRPNHRGHAIFWVGG